MKLFRQRLTREERYTNNKPGELWDECAQVCLVAPCKDGRIKGTNLVDPKEGLFDHLCQIDTAPDKREMVDHPASVVYEAVTCYYCKKVLEQKQAAELAKLEEEQKREMEAEKPEQPPVT